MLGSIVTAPHLEVKLLYQILDKNWNLKQPSSRLNKCKNDKGSSGSDDWVFKKCWEVSDIQAMVQNSVQYDTALNFLDFKVHYEHKNCKQGF